MPKSFLEKRDLKALTTLSLFNAIEIAKKDKHISNDDGLIFFTSFGIVTAANIVISPFEDEALNNENFARFIMQSSKEHAAKHLVEHGNDDILDTKTAFILEDVTISAGNTTSDLSIMILFSEDIAGISFGNRR
ncbi:hypothetical protein [Bacillus sp. SM2101]|uniref:hypothetical protein n=1 Tax=Bacillus sp. SM2101 TaxID=2805366 RepID=UPI001BDE6732|nr:hypothetical protein [Bacillus sp. SM2101]